MENARCPGCGASVRPQASWCSLCYLDLRATSQLVAVADARPDAPGGAGIAAPLVDAALEPVPVRVTETAAGSGDIHGAHDICDADLVADPQASAERKLAAAAQHWPCACGVVVPLDRDECPACGAAFLGELRGEVGRHRQGVRTRRSWLAHSRGLRLGLAALVAALIAVVVPAVLALFG